MGILKETGNEVTTVELGNSLYIDDLSKLDEYCPYLETLIIDNCPSIYDLSFIYRCSNLKEVKITENGFVTPALVEYLDENGIKHNITDNDLKISQEVDKIIDEIIKPNMSDEEKIQAVTSYVIRNYDYNKKLVEISNLEPLSSMINNGEGVCAGYAYLTNTLLRKAGINSYEIVSDGFFFWSRLEFDRIG